MKCCEFCSEWYKPRKCNFKRQRCCGAPSCRAMLKALLQRKYLEAGYWRSECIRFKRRRHRHRCRFVSKNPDSFTILNELKGGLSRILDRVAKLGGEMMEVFENEIEACFTDILCGAL